MKVAIVHDWFKDVGGAENVVSSLLTLYPDADFFALVDFFSDENRKKILEDKTSTYTFIQRLPLAKHFFQHYLFLFPWAIERLDIRDYDLIISSSHAVAKGVLTGPYQLHICYSHTPIRYAWDMYFDYKETHNIKGIREKVLSYILHKIRIWDSASSNRVDYFIANSSFVKKRIFKYYRRQSEIIAPPVDTNRFKLYTNKEEFYFTASRLVPYKKTKIIVDAFISNGKQLLVAGTGSELEEIKSIATDNITILGEISDSKMLHLMQRAKAFVFASQEDFGITPVEAMSCGTPVIAFFRGGCSDTIIENITGVFFKHQTPQAINESINKFEQMSFDYEHISNYASKFSKQNFEEKINTFVSKKYNEFIKQ